MILSTKTTKPKTHPAKPTAKTTTRIAPRYRVLIHNDNVTPMDYVVGILLECFKKLRPDAITIMIEAHHSGVALVDVMGLEEAEFRVDQAHFLARSIKFPLTFTIEPE
jgi:ATP-dependent Clp protease adaptor protein ClpS